MKYLYSLLLFVGLFAGTAKATVVGGTVTNNNTALTNGSVQITLSGCANPLINSSTGAPATPSYNFTLTANGNLPSASVIGNDVIYCSGATGNTYYEIKAYNSAGSLLWDRYYRITGAYWSISTANVLTNFAVSSYLQTNPVGDQVVNVPANNKLSLAGGQTLIQKLKIGQDPVASNDAATKNYVDQTVVSVSGTVNVVNKVSRTGDSMQGPLLLSSDPTVPLQAADKQYVDTATSPIAGLSTSVSNLSTSVNTVTASVNNKVNKSGDTLTGPLVLPADPISAFQAATKQYVDTKVSQSSGTGTATAVGVAGSLQATDGAGHLEASQVMIDSTGQSITVPGSIVSKYSNGVANSDQFLTGTGGNGIANAIAAGVPSLFIPPSTSSIEGIGIPRGSVPKIASSNYQGFGQNFITSYNLLPSSAAQRGRDQLFVAGANCLSDAFTGYSQKNCFSINNQVSGAGWNPGSNGAYGWSVNQGLSVNTDINISGISQSLTVNHNTYGNGDSGNYIYCKHADGDPDSSGEGKVCLAVQGGSTGLVLSGTLTAVDPVNGLLTIGSSGYNGFPVNNRIASDSGMIINTTHGGTLVHITADQNLSLTTVEAVVPSSICSLTNSPGPIANTQGGYQQLNPLGAIDSSGNLVQYSLTATCSQGSLVPKKAIEMVCDAPSRPETIMPIGAVPVSNGVYTVTTNLSYQHSGCTLYQGGTKGAIEYISDRATGLERNGGGNLIRTAYHVVGAYDTHHLAYAFPFLGTLKPISNNQHNLGSSITFANVTRVNNVVTACETTNSNVSSLGSLIKVQTAASGSSDASFNGTVMPTGYAGAGSCLTWATSGLADVTNPVSLTLSYGGNDAYGAAVIWPMVEPYKVFATQLSYGSVPNGQFGIKPNDELSTWAANDTLEQLHNTGTHQFGFQALAIANQVSTPDSPSATGVFMSQGPGVSNPTSGTAQYGTITIDDRGSDTSRFQNYGGQQQPADAIQVFGPHRNGLSFATAPMGTSFSVGCPDGAEAAGRNIQDFDLNLNSGHYLWVRNCTENTITHVFGAGNYFTETWSPAGIKWDAPVTFNGHILNNIGAASVGTDATNLDQVKALIGNGGVSGVSNFNGRTGAVQPGSSDYTVSQISGAAPINAPVFTGSAVFGPIQFDINGKAAYFGPTSIDAAAGTVRVGQNLIMTGAGDIYMQGRSINQIGNVQIGQGGSISTNGNQFYASDTSVQMKGSDGQMYSVCNTHDVCNPVVAAGVTSFSPNGGTARTGAVTAQSGDYTVDQITGAAPLNNAALTGTTTINGKAVCLIDGTSCPPNTNTNHLITFGTYVLSNGALDLQILTGVSNMACSANDTSGVYPLQVYVTLSNGAATLHMRGNANDGVTYTCGYN